MMSGCKSQTMVQMWELLICPICKDLFNSPKMLPCVHSFCEQCLGALTRGQHESFQCPVCRAPSQLPPGGVAEIPCNFFLNSILDIMKRQNANKEDIVCDACSVNVLSSLRCADCDVLLCTKCLQAHEVGVENGARDHQGMTSLESLATTQSTQHKLHMALKCEHHPKQDLCFFCSSCAELACQDCVIAKHVTHIFVSASDAVPSCKAKLSTLLGQMTMKILFLSDARREIKDTEGHLRCNISNIKNRTRETKNELLTQGVGREKLDGDEKILLGQLDLIAQRKLRILGEQCGKLETRLGLIESCRTFTSDLMLNGSDNELLMMENCIMESLGGLCQHTPEIPIECSEDSFMGLQRATGELTVSGDQRSDAHDGANVLGTIVTGSGASGCCFATGEGLASAVVGQCTTFTVTVKNDQNKSCDEGRGSIVARVKTPQGGYFCAEMIEYRLGKHKFRYRTYIAGPHLLRITIKGEEILGSPFESLSNGSTDYSRRGCLVTKFGRVGTRYEEFTSPQGLAVDRLSRIYVADTGNHRIQVFNESGRFLFMFGREGLEPGEFSAPCDVTISRTGHVLVADKMNNRIQAFTCDGKFISQLHSGITEPTAVTTDNYNNTVVVDSQHTRVLVFTAGGELLRSISRVAPGGRLLENVHDVACSQTGEILLISRITNNKDGVVKAKRQTYSSLIQSFDNNGHFIQEFVTPSYACPAASWCRLVTDNDDRVLATGAGNKVQVFTTAGGHLTNITFMQKGYKQIEISAITLTPNGSVVVADTVNGRILVF